MSMRPDLSNLAAEPVCGSPSEAAKPFFTRGDFDEWREEVLSLLKQDDTRVHEIVKAGCLPVFSRVSPGQWFGVTATLRARGARPPQGLSCDARRVWWLQDLLRSGDPMVPSQQHVLQGHHGGPYRVMALDDLVVGDGPVEVHRRLHINNLYPHEQKQWKWLRGGDLLYASAILFVLLDVRYMTVCDGPGLRNSIETATRITRPGYFYYDKTILVPAASVRVDNNFEWSGEGGDDELSDLTRLLPAPDRGTGTVLGCWLWDKLADSCM